MLLVGGSLRCWGCSREQGRHGPCLHGAFSLGEEADTDQRNKFVKSFRIVIRAKKETHKKAENKRECGKRRVTLAKLVRESLSEAVTFELRPEG